MKDQKTVSNEFHELEYVAKKFNLPVWQVMKAKEELGTNERALIYQELEKVASGETVYSKAMFWLNNGQTGSSSETMWNCLMGNKDFSISFPYDPSDFNRCYGLLEMVPEWKSRLSEVAVLSPEWKGIIENWDKLVAYLKDQKNTGNLNGMYQFMQDLRGEAKS